MLTGVSKNSIVFADRPVRAAGHVTTEQFIMQWDEGKDNFAIDPPNATVSVLGGDGSDVSDAVVTLKTPKLEGTTLTFDVAVLEGDLTGATGLRLSSSTISQVGLAVAAAFTAVAFMAVMRTWAMQPSPMSAGTMAGATTMPQPTTELGTEAEPLQREVKSLVPPSAPRLPLLWLRISAPPACGYYPYPPCY